MVEVIRVNNEGLRPFLDSLIKTLEELTAEDFA